MIAPVCTETPNRARKPTPDERRKCEPEASSCGWRWNVTETCYRKRLFGPEWIPGDARGYLSGPATDLVAELASSFRCSKSRSRITQEQSLCSPLIRREARLAQHMWLTPQTSPWWTWHAIYPRNGGDTRCWLGGFRQARRIAYAQFKRGIFAEAAWIPACRYTSQIVGVCCRSTIRTVPSLDFARRCVSSRAPLKNVKGADTVNCARPPCCSTHCSRVPRKHCQSLRLRYTILRLSTRTGVVASARLKCGDTKTP
jgi:hypothetical protein